MSPRRPLLSSPSTLPDWYLKHPVASRFLFLSLAASIVISCTLTSVVSPQSGEPDIVLPEAYTPEVLASAELEMLALMMSPIAEGLGPEGEALLEAHQEGRRATLEQLLADLQSSQSRTGGPGLARPAPSRNDQAALLGAIFTTIFSLGMSQGRSSRPLEETKTEGSTTTTLKLTVTATGSRTEVSGEITITTTEAGASVTEKAKIKASVDVCPDADGHVPVELSIRWESGASAGGMTAGGQMSASGKVTGNVDDNADLTGYDFDLTTDFSQQTPGSRAGQVVGDYVEFMVRGSVGKGSDATLQAERGRSAGEGKKSTVEGAAKSLVIANLLAAAILGMAEGRWRSGFCLEIIITGVEDRNQVELSSTSHFRAIVRHKFEGRELNLPMTAALTGDRSVDPTERTNAPVEYTYVAGEKPKDTATVNLEARSRRGIARKSIDFTTGDTNWRPISDVAPWSGQVCFLDEPFTIKLGGFMPETYSFQPESETNGSFTMTHTIGGGCEVRGTGTYTIEITEREDAQETEADITLSVTPTMYCPGLTVPREKTVLHILLQPFDDPDCP